MKTNLVHGDFDAPEMVVSLYADEGQAISPLDITVSDEEIDDVIASLTAAIRCSADPNGVANAFEDSLGKAADRVENEQRARGGLKPRILVFGVGGAGCNAVNNMIAAGLSGVEFAVANTDAQHLAQCKTDRRIQLGAELTQGLGAGARADVGRAAAEESVPAIDAYLEGVNMVFVTAGMGGGTGTGAAPVIARAARERGILTVGVVTKPFRFEGQKRLRAAEEGLVELRRQVDTLIVVSNQNLFRMTDTSTTFSQAFTMADEVLHSGVRSITDLILVPGLVNLDFADVRSIMRQKGRAVMGTGLGTGEARAFEAAMQAITNPLFDEPSLQRAKAVLVNITGDIDMTLLEVDEVANTVADSVDPEAEIIFGAAFDASLQGAIRVSIVATGLDEEAVEAPAPPQSQPQPAPPVKAPLVAAAVAAPVSQPAAAMVATPALAARATDAPSRPPLRIVDPLDADAEEDLTDFVELSRERRFARWAEPIVERPVVKARERRSGWFGLFGALRPERRKKPLDMTPPPETAVAPPRPAPAAGPRAPQDADTLEIPSFLRRQMN